MCPETLECPTIPDRLCHGHLDIAERDNHRSHWQCRINAELVRANGSPGIGRVAPLGGCTRIAAGGGSPLLNGQPDRNRQRASHASRDDKANREALNAEGAERAHCVRR
jgi:hypothetical protein